jgi:hypothetical protein
MFHHTSPLSLLPLVFPSRPSLTPAAGEADCVSVADSSVVQVAETKQKVSECVYAYDRLMF